MGEASKQVLVVDDARLMRLVIFNLLAQDSRFKVTGYAENGQQALDMLKEKQPDLVIVDIEMPVMDGLTFLRHARLKTRAKIVVLSSVAVEGSPRALEARRLGADAVIQKPSGSVSYDLIEKSGAAVLATLRRVTGLS